MGFFVIIVVIAAVIVSLAVKYFFNIGWISVSAAALIVSAVFAPATYAVGSAISITEATTFHEYWNGYETEATSASITCTRDGACVHSYNCDPYTTHYQVSVKDADGEGSHLEDRTRTDYHDCPYSTQETSYYVNSTLQNFTIASHLMTGGQYRFGAGIPGGRQTAPKEWLDAQKRIKAGKPGPVTAVKNYSNYILASSTSLFEKYSDNIDSLKNKNLLPTPSEGVYSLYQANKAYFVPGVKNINEKSLTDQVAHLNGAAGIDLQGDVHVVFAPADKVGNSSDYSNALLAYWQSKEFGRNAISKNTIIVVVGVENEPDTNGKSVAKAKWVNAFTGMPIGNEAMLTQISSDLEDQTIDKTFIGTPEYSINSKKVIHSEGKLENILWGHNKFDRVSMSVKGSDDNGPGFEYLKDELRPSAGAIVGMSLIVVLFGSLTYFGAITLSLKYSSNNTMKSDSILNRKWTSEDRKKRTYTY